MQIRNCDESFLLCIVTEKHFGNFSSTWLWSSSWLHFNIILNIIISRRCKFNIAAQKDFGNFVSTQLWCGWKVEENVSHLTHISGLIFAIVSKQEDGIWNKQHISNTPQNKHHCSEHTTNKSLQAPYSRTRPDNYHRFKANLRSGWTARSNICPFSKVTLPTSSSPCYTAAVLSSYQRCKNTKENALYIIIVLVSQAKQCIIYNNHNGIAS